MKGQSGLIFGLLAAIIIAVFAVINVDGVRVNYLFGTAEWPLILVILGSVFMGAIIAGALGMVRIYRLQAELRRLRAGTTNAGLNETLPEEQTDGALEVKGNFKDESPKTRAQYRKETNQ
ncbi:lipopolysaccharide assembly protein LapA domain-containing protein [Alkalihalobacillus oceani]|uniref:LapA family protein n=1 Tax=Halalkalibacter oceani TaxID=1653776 RepID=UPI00203DE240|nr:lipopolysaccharide assembly protein LapA domain-containing protein [Halalkalibacter oceani]MCM3762278.1 lipopolysaccharide assembly protein LapA domain-containing protein [Halalkalibacter oceani]